MNSSVADYDGSSVVEQLLPCSLNSYKAYKIQLLAGRPATLISHSFLWLVQSSNVLAQGNNLRGVSNHRDTVAHFSQFNDKGCTYFAEAVSEG
ncbi:hypothetical protein [Parendozoicomonas sp. Alg238-R29]|uniref:hypothetical protein n=1 Tax=Parendozoicomonas sp. Alg238-R29 TaxID=2993446 RepID=UPI00248F1F2F|nr:hypothetical protein [Parendozoicomonas sp. Alg238-R29]